MALVVTALIALALMAAAVLIHYEALRFTGELAYRLDIPPRRRVLVVIAACISAHLLEIVLYAAVYAAFSAHPAMGTVEGTFNHTALDFFYFSITSYTTLGIGEIYPVGPMRIIAGVESLNGLLLITWSASFTYLVMQKWWHPELDDAREAPPAPPARKVNLIDPS